MAEGKKITMDETALADILECPVCTNMAGPPLYQCSKGHLLCSDCYKKVQIVECPSCREKLNKLAPIRNLMLERLVEVSELQYPCKFDSEGCKRTFVWGKAKENHEKACPHRTLKCPKRECQDIVSCAKLLHHLESAHKLIVSKTRFPQWKQLPLTPGSSWSPLPMSDSIILFVFGEADGCQIFARHCIADCLDSIQYRLRFQAPSSDFCIDFTCAALPIDAKDKVELEEGNFIFLPNKTLQRLSAPLTDETNGSRIEVSLVVDSK
eukprot:TRINITY_DN8934_c0_g1_i1.p1 TRINITY_DN8934_c0_g1~~TRINITY_DN8934_c0_g1_i1.p1  ORF type:complete len:266 (+),score=24.35 TRINITY_DN8934_c0_g1_i1:165-962(+)